MALETFILNFEMLSSELKSGGIVIEVFTFLKRNGGMTFRTWLSIKLLMKLPTMRRFVAANAEAIFLAFEYKLMGGLRGIRR